MKMAFFNVMSNTSEHILLTVSGTFLVPLSYNIRRGDHLVQQGFQQGVESGNNFHPQLGIELKILVLTLNRILNHLAD